MYFIYRVYLNRFEHWCGEVSQPKHCSAVGPQNLLGLRKTDSVWLVPGTLRPELA